jgi:predicted dehydrogenase
MQQKIDGISRRSFMNRASAAGAASAFTIVRPELVRGQGKAMLKAGVVGCGGRGTQAIVDFLTGTQNTQVTVMGDLFEDRLKGLSATCRRTSVCGSRGSCQGGADKRFVGFDAYQKVINSDVDIVFLATPPGYRPMHFEAAVNAKKHVFCEKPFGTDPCRRAALHGRGEEVRGDEANGGLGRAAPLQAPYVEAVDRIKQGEIGDVTALYAYWVGTPVIQQPKGRDPQWGDMTWQHRNWYSYVWISGDQVVEQHLHNIDVCNWVMGTHPVKVVATGGAVWRPRTEVYGNIYDHISADFEYANGVRMSSYCRQFPRELAQNISEMIVGSKGRIDSRKLARAPINPYVAEHTALAASIRGDGPYINHGMTVAESTMTCIMARESAYSGQELTWDQMMKSQLDLQPKSFGYDQKMEAPPLPVPGVYKFA